MAERIKVGLFYQYNENWIGGTYYILNLVKALKRLPEEQKPHLSVICEKEEEFGHIKNLEYPYTSWVKLNLEMPSGNIFKRTINKLYRILFGYNLFGLQKKFDGKTLAAVFPATKGLVTGNNLNKFYWIPDFQEQVLPHFFSKREIKSRVSEHAFIAKSGHHVVFSSNDAFRMFEQLYPKAQVKKHVMHFAVSHSSDYKKLDIDLLKQKFHIDRPYFFVANQFWKHKNHLVILEAIAHLTSRGITNFQVVFTGKEHDYRNPDYFDQIKKFVADHQLCDKVSFLGFIDRLEQLCLMSGAIAVIQPSLFEGWSTVVEDAKAMQQWVIASDLAVHKEQLSRNASFFPAHDAIRLSEIMSEGIKKGFPKSAANYDESISQFAREFEKIILS